MGFYAITSISGSPGVTTTAVAWATANPKPTLLIEADMAGGSPILAGRYRAQIPHEKSILALAARDADADVDELLRDQSIALPSAVADSRVVPSIAERAQARGMTPHWSHIGTALKNLSRDNAVDVVVDLGRYGTPDAAHSLIDSADALIVMSGTDLPSLIKLANNLPAIADRTPFALVTVCFRDADIEGFPRGEAQEVVSKVPVVGAVPWARSAAAAYSLGHTHTRARALRSYHAAIHQVRTQALHLSTEHEQVLTGEASR